MASARLLHRHGPLLHFNEKRMPVHKAKRGIISSSHLRGSLTSFCAHLNGKPTGSGLHFRMHYLTFLQAGIFLILFLGRLISVVTSTCIELPAWAVKLLGFGSMVQSCRGSATSTLTLIFFPQALLFLVQFCRYIMY